MQICCSVCKDLFITHSQVMVTKCGHLYHVTCIEEWCKRNMTCPQCRSKLKEHPRRVYFDVENDTETDSSSLQYKLDKITYDLQLKDNEARKLQDKVKQLENETKAMKEYAKAVEVENDQNKDVIRHLKKKAQLFQEETVALKKNEQAYEQLKIRVSHFQNLEKLITGTIDEVEALVNRTPVTELSLRQLCQYVVALKQQCRKNEVKRAEAIKQVSELQKCLQKAEKEKDVLLKQVDILTVKNDSLMQEIACHGNFLETLIESPQKTAASSSAPRKPIKRAADFIEIGPSTSENVEKDGFCMNILFDNPPTKMRNTKSYFSLESKMTDNLKSRRAQGSTSNCLSADSVPGPSKCQNNPTNITNSSSIFKKPSTAALSSSENKIVERSTMSNFVFDGMGGSKRISLATPSPKEELLEMHNHMKLKKKKSGSVRHSSLQTLEGYFS